MDNVTLFYIFTLLYLISTPLTRVNQMMLFYLMLGLAPHGMDLGLLGFGLLGLGLWALGLGLIFILCLLLTFRRLEGKTSNVKVNVLFLHQ